MHPTFETKFIFVVQWVEFKKTFWKKLNTLYFVNGIVIIVLSSFIWMMYLSLSLHERGLVLDFVIDILNFHSIF